MIEARKPRVLFSIGDAEWAYTRGKMRRLVERVADEGRFEICVASHGREICEAFTHEKVETFCLPGRHMPLNPDQAIAMTDLMIRFTRDVIISDSRLPLWKTIAMDDYLGCLDMFSHPPLPIEPDMMVCPLMGVDNNTANASHFYTAMLLEAAKAKIPILGLEISPLGNKQTLGASLAGYYGVKSEFSVSFALQEELAPAANVFVLPPEEVYLLSCRDDSYWDDYLGEEKRLRERLGLAPGRVVIFVPHNVAFIYETKQILRSLKNLPYPFSIILRVDPNIARQGLREKEIAAKVYRDEIAALPHVIIDEEGGWLWSLLLSDVLVAPAFSVFTELSFSYGKLTVISQGWGESSWVGENLFLEPRSEHIVQPIRAWLERRVLPRKCVSNIVSFVLDAPEKSDLEESAHGA